MADIFVSYASEDRERVRGLVELLESDGWSVWWDRSLKTGETWPDVIERELGRASCVVVVWSKSALNSHWVRLEAHSARQRGNLVPVAIDRVAPPDEFTVYQTLDLEGYPSDPHDEELTQLGEAVCTLLRRARRRRLMPWALAALLLLVPALGGVCWGTGACFRSGGDAQERAPLALPENSIAILEFDYRGDAAQRYLATGFADLVAAQLQAVGYLVASRIAVEALPAESDIALIRDRLRVRWALDGELHQAPQGVQVSAQLVDLETGYQKSSWRFEATFAEMVALQNRFARTVIDELDVPAIAFAESSRIAPSVSSDAYVSYLRGLDLLHDAAAVADIDAAEAAFAEALRLAPDFARAHAGMCRTKLRRYQRLRSVEHFEEATRHCDRALGLNDSSAETMLALGWLRLYGGDYAEARSAFENAADLDPSSADAYIGLGHALEALREHSGAESNFARATVVQPGLWKAHNELAMFLVRRGRDEDAVERFELALEMAPQSPAALNNLGAALMFADELALAVEAFDKSLAIEPDPAAYNNLGATYFMLRDFVGAAQAYERALELSPDDYRLHANLADSLAMMDGAGAQRHYETALELAQERLSVDAEDVHALSGAAAFHAALGHRMRALERMSRALERAPRDPEAHRVAAITHLRLGSPEAAIDEIERAIELGYPKSLIARDPVFAELSAREEFNSIVSSR